MEYLYVCHFSNGHIKVGRSIHPKSRIAQHADRVACIGIELIEHHVVECISFSAPAEMALIDACAAMASKRNKSEWFEGLDYLDVCELADSSARISYAATAVNRGRQFWTGHEFDDDIPPAYVFRDILAEHSYAEVQEIAGMSGVPFTTLWKIRAGDTVNPGIETVRKFAGHMKRASKPRTASV